MKALLVKAPLARGFCKAPRNFVNVLLVKAPLVKHPCVCRKKYQNVHMCVCMWQARSFTRASLGLRLCKATMSFSRAFSRCPTRSFAWALIRGFVKALLVMHPYICRKKTKMCICAYVCCRLEVSLGLHWG